MAEASAQNTAIVSIAPKVATTLVVPVNPGGIQKPPMLGGSGPPSDTLGLNGQGYVDFVGLGFYEKVNGHWELRADADDGETLSDPVAWYILAKQ